MMEDVAYPNLELQAQRAVQELQCIRYSQKIKRKTILALPELLPRQEAVLQAQKTNRIVTDCTGRRGGKSTEGIRILIDWQAENKTHKSWWLAPTYQNLKPSFERVIRNCQPLIKHSKRSPEYMIEWRSGHITEFHTTKIPDNLRSEGNINIIWDEIAFSTKQAFDAITPMLFDNPDTRLVALTTPNGLNWFHKEIYSPGLNPDNEGLFKTFTGTSLDNTHLDSRFIQEWIAQGSQRFVDQEIYAKFVEGARSAFKGVDGIFKSMALPKYDSNHHYSAGLDVGRTRDLTALVIFDKTANQVVDVFTIKGGEWPYQRKLIKERLQKWGMPKVLGDATSLGKSMMDELRYDGVHVEDYNFSGAGMKNQLFLGAITLVENQSVTIPDIEDPLYKFHILKHDLKAYETHITQRGNITYTIPRDDDDEYGHGDCGVAFCLATYGHQPGISQKIEMMTGKSDTARRIDSLSGW